MTDALLVLTWVVVTAVGLPLVLFSVFVLVKVSAYAWRSGCERFELDRKRKKRVDDGTA